MRYRAVSGQPGVLHSMGSQMSDWTTTIVVTDEQAKQEAKISWKHMAYETSIQGFSTFLWKCHPGTKHVSRLLLSTSQGLGRPGRRFIYCRKSKMHTFKWACSWCGFGFGTWSGEKTIDRCRLDWNSVAVLTTKAAHCHSSWSVVSSPGLDSTCKRISQQAEHEHRFSCDITSNPIG